MKFHDGSPLTAQDVVFSFTAHPGPQDGGGRAGADRAVPVDPPASARADSSTVKLTLTKPNAFIPVIVSAGGFSIVKSGTTDFSTGNGTGPFTLTGFDAAARTSLARYDGYWQNNQPYLDAIQIVVIAEDATRLQAVTSGSQDVVDNITGASTLLLKGSVEPYMLKNGGWVGLTMFGDTAPFNNQKIIQAMQYAADRKKIMSVVAPGIDIITPDIPIPPGDPFFPQGCSPGPYDPDKAKSLLQGRRRQRYLQLRRVRLRGRQAGHRGQLQEHGRGGAASTPTSSPGRTPRSSPTSSRRSRRSASAWRGCTSRRPCPGSTARAAT